jgi:hypothetical protein
MRYFGLTGLVSAAALAVSISGAHATLYYDTALHSQDFYNGSGNQAADGNSHWATDVQANNMELGLTVVERYIGFYTPDAGTATYHVPTGATTDPGHTGSAWGFDFSINTGTQISLNQVNASLCMVDVGLGTSGCFDPYDIPDNTYTGANLAQNSEALSFPLIAAVLGDPTYDIDANDTYIFTLSITDQAGAQLSSVSATVIAGSGATASPAPEPATLALFGASLAGMGFVKRKLRKTKA